MLRFHLIIVHHMKLTAKRIQLPLVKDAQITLLMIRADLIHPLASGNKFYKLAPTITMAKAKQVKVLLSFGGAFSNHIHALALIAQAHDLKSVGIIRGEPAYANNPTLSDAQKAGMQLEFVDRVTYKRRYDDEYLQQLRLRYPDAMIIPEGGSNQLAVKGCMQLANEINNLYQAEVIAVAAGTGATAAGLACGAKENQTVIAYSVLKDKTLKHQMKQFIANENKSAKVKIEQADFGGYAKLNKQLLDFILDWLDKTGILLDPIYTGKMCMQLIQQIAANEFNQGTTVAMVHSGGLQGWRGMQQRVVNLNGQKSWDKIQAYLCRDIS